MTPFDMGPEDYQPFDMGPEDPLAAHDEAVSQSRSKTPDLIITWPKTKPLEEYLAELERAQAQEKLINFRVSHLPKRAEIGARCFVTYKGWARGYNIIIALKHLEEGVVEGWPAGNYIIRNPEWFPLPKLRACSGFQGYHYATEAQVERFLRQT